MSAFSVINMNHSLRYQRELEGNSTAEAATLARRALVLIACGKATHDTFRSLDMDAIAGLVKTLEAKRFWLGKCLDGNFIRYQADKPLTRKGQRTFTGAIGPFLSPLGTAYYLCQRNAGQPVILTPEQAERLAREDNDVLWTLRRENLLAEMTMSEQERDDFERDMAAEYEDD